MDSTLSAIEGIDFLAALRDEAVREHVASATNRAMRGEVALAEVYAERLGAVMPTHGEIVALGHEYVTRMEPGAKDALASVARMGVKIVLVSAGIMDAILPLARAAGIPEGDVHAVRVFTADTGGYTGFDNASPLTRNGGKATVVRALGLPGPVLAVGDGATDAEMRTATPPAVDAFAAYIGVVNRPSVVAMADFTVEDFSQLPAIVRG